MLLENICEKISGLAGHHFQYYKVCKRKLWFYSYYIRMENSSNLVKEGKVIHNSTYSRTETKNLSNMRVALDAIQDEEIIEVKRSSSFEEAHLLQTGFYLVYLNCKGEDLKSATIAYPEERRRRKIELDKIQKEVKKAAIKIKEITERKYPPERKWRSICKPCAYAELCWG